MSIVTEIKKSSPTVFRRIYMKRRQTTGEYESDWQLIPDKYIQKWGTIEMGIDDIKVNFYRYSGFAFTVDNTSGYFSDESDDKSFWYGYMTRYKTLVKVTGGYIADDGTEYPTNSTLFVGILDDTMAYQENNLVNFNCNHLSRIFEEHPAANIVGLGATLHASEIFAKVKAHTQGSNVLIFQKYITSGGWTISDTSNDYNMQTSTTLQGKSTWELMRNLAEAENKLLTINRYGDLYFGAKTTTAAAMQFHFSGYGDDDNTYGKNVIGNISVDENIKQVYNRIFIKHIDAASAAAYTLTQESWDWADSSSSFKYGVRSYEMESQFMQTVAARAIAGELYTTYKWPKYLVKFKAKFVPQLNVYDWVTFTYKSVQKMGDSRWGSVLWGYGLWGKRNGFNINIENDDFYIQNMSHNLENFTTDLVLKEK